MLPSSSATLRRRKRARRTTGGCGSDRESTSSVYLISFSPATDNLGKRVACRRHRLAKMSAGIDRMGYRPDDPTFEASRALSACAGADPECFRAVLAVGLMLERQVDVLKRPGLHDKVLRLGADWRDRPVPGPERDALLSIVPG